MCTYEPGASDSRGDDVDNSSASKSKADSFSSSSTEEVDTAHERHCTNSKHNHSSSEPFHPTSSCVVDEEDDGGMPLR